MLRNWREWIIWPLTLSAMLAGGFGVFAASYWSFAGHELAEKLGEALFIAGFLAVTVDQYVKRRMLREVSHDVAKYLIGYELPPEAQDRIKELMGCTIVRENYEAHYQASKTETQGKLRLDVTISYDVKNITNHSESYEQRLALEARYSPSIAMLECKTRDPKASYSKNGKDISELRDGLLQARGPVINIKPSKNKEGFRYRISDTHSLIQPEEYSDLISFLAPTINVSITAKFPHGFTFCAPNDHGQEAPGNTFDYQRLFMPSEHIRVRWSKEKTFRFE